MRWAVTQCEALYAGAFMDCIRGVDFLASRPEVDAARLAVTGGSQGGGLAFATATSRPGRP